MKPARPRFPQRAAFGEDADGPTTIFGIHALDAALRNPARRFIALFLTENAERRLGEAIGTRKLPIERVSPRDLDRRLGPDTVHQGALAEVEPLDDLPLAVLARRSAGRPLLVLDQVTDPHNVGAVMRSAAVFDAGGLVMTRRHSPPLGGALAKAASGALELVPVALVGNLARALEELAELGFLRIGLDGAADALLEDQPFDRPVALVLGAEGKGLRQLTAQTCDHLCRIATSDTLASLNVSNAAAVALHLSAMRRRAGGSAG